MGSGKCKKEFSPDHISPIFSNRHSLNRGSISDIGGTYDGSSAIIVPFLSDSCAPEMELLKIINKAKKRNKSFS